MDIRLNRTAIVVLAVLTAGGCGEQTERSAGKAQTEFKNAVRTADEEHSAEDAATEFNNEDIMQIASSYKHLRLMTPESVEVNPEFAFLCTNTTFKQVLSARTDNGPHANCSVQIFMNDLASSAFEDQAIYPVGAVIVKEKTMLGFIANGESELQGKGNGIGGMLKRDRGYDEANGDWEYFYVKNSDPIESGKIQSCVECHKKSRKTDFVFGYWAKATDDGDPYSN